MGTLSPWPGGASRPPDYADRSVSTGQTAQEDVPVLMQGFPPPPQQRVTLDNWQQAPFNRWSFHHVREVVPTARVARGAGQPSELPTAPAAVGELPVLRAGGLSSTVADVMATTATDGWLVDRKSVV